MNKRGKFLFLGTGASAGIPMIGCHCRVCKSPDTHDRRLRPAGVLFAEGKTILIDAGPDFRAQALLNHLEHIDAVMLTHAHFDHVAGIDELRVYYLLYRKSISVLCSAATYQELQRRFDYIFREKSYGISLAAQLDFHVLEEERGVIDFAGFNIRYVSYIQGDMKVTGYRLGDFAYISDIRNFPESIFDDLKGVRTLVVSALRHKPSYMHLSVDEAIDFGKKVGAEETFFTHISHELSHAETNAMLPKGFALAHDGLTLEFTYD